ncbi:hypothetical protein CHL76_11935 [Marinococcus halophilus]|uniref:Initiator Rep protein WH1 domain-containing protein n=1 Tax=Marinococcus halophilus TaxID=1371 RepID=A0A510Y7U4_MARHA|nr:replication initiation protein [Marinococcus halophilus]OZT79619.1 hypothetical protein CHL76_11935 [Marinococcus halophilus]GEK59446.1 hypothetical protein MHA01_23510 [Marinococcus halophilus]
MVSEQMNLPGVSEISPEHTVTQSNDLIMSRQDLTIQERRIIYAFASLIHKEDNDFKIHRVKVKDIADILGIQTKNYYRKVQNIVLGLQQKGAYIQKEKSELYVNWVASSEYFHGQGCVELEFSQKMKPYLLELKQRFTPFKLRNVLRLRSEYSMRMYELLKKDEFRHQVSYSIPELRQLLNIEEGKYEPYANFKNRILKKAQEELENYTDLTFSYVEIKEGRKVAALTFAIQPNDKYVENAIEENDNNEIIQLLITYGIDEKQAKKLLTEHEKDKVIRNIEHIASQNENQFHNLAGALIDAIRKDYAASQTLPFESSIADIEYEKKSLPEPKMAELIVKDLIKKYSGNNSGPIPKWMVEDELERRLNEEGYSNEELETVKNHWLPYLTK